MSTAVAPTLAQSGTRPGPLALAPAAPALWPQVAVAFASLSIAVGLIWDIAWHRSVGRDGLFSPPHLAIYLGGLVSGLTCAWLVLRATFGRDAALAAGSVRFWGFRGPLGAWACIWGAIAMGTSAPFDDWWHNAYGLDVKILSPPHALLATGMLGIQFGAMLQVLSAQNRGAVASGASRALAWLLAFTAGVILVMLNDMAMAEAWFANTQHGQVFHVVSAALYPFVLAAVGRAAKLRWPATTAAACYMLLIAAMGWILPLVPAEPLLGPVYRDLTHLVPPPFPLLLVLPALAMDVVLRRTGAVERGGGLRDWGVAAALGVAFVAVFSPASWWFAEFLMSPAARNAVFFADRWDYNNRPGPWQYQFWDAMTTRAELLGALAWATLAAVLSSRLGLWWGRWMRGVQR